MKLTKVIDVQNIEDTKLLGERIGSLLKGGEVIELVSDLGGGKTTFVKSLASGLGSKDNVHSPSFTLRNDYEGNGLTLYHFDFYRLNEPGLIKNEIAELLGQKDAILAIEWSDLVASSLPDDRLRVEIKPKSENERQFTFSYSDNLSYLLEF